MLAKAMSQITEVIFSKLSACFRIIVEDLEEVSKNKKEDSDWEGFAEKFKAY